VDELASGFKIGTIRRNRHCRIVMNASCHPLKLTGLTAALLFLAIQPVLLSEEPAAAAPAPGAPAEPFVPAMREISPGVFEIGKLRLDKGKNSIAFPGKINMAKDLIEYVLVTPNGPTHESLLVSEVQPSDLHFAMLLLGAKGAGLSTPAASDAPPGQIDAKYLKDAPKLKGDNLSVTATWKDKQGKEHITPVDEWLLNKQTKKPAAPGWWIYTGSMFGADGGFLAQQLGMCISVVTNPSALINNPRKGNNNDLIWEVNEKTVPPVDTPIEITFTIQPGATEAQ
jgi:hypothetical protein